MFKKILTASNDFANFSKFDFGSVQFAQFLGSVWRTAQEI